jgi:DNA-binding MarR family transcriptional regulator
MSNKSENKTSSDYSLWALLDATGFAIYRLRELELARIGLTIEQSVLLNLIQSKEHGATVKWIKDTTLRQQNTISITVDRMVKAGLVAKEKIPGEREFRIVCTRKGTDLLSSTPTDSLDSLFSALSNKKKQTFFSTLCALLEKARSLLVYDTPPFMRYTGKSVSPRIKNQQDREADRLSGYRLWMYLNTVRFTISRLRELELARIGITVEQSSILKVLVDMGTSAKLKDLEYATLRQHHSISTIINRMIKLNLVAREKKPGEKNYRVSITENGRTILNQMTSSAIEITFCVLDETEKHYLAASLFELYTAARNLLGVPGMPFAATVSSQQ